MEDVRIDVGVDTVLDINLSNVDFAGVECVVFTIKNLLSTKSKPAVERRLKTAELHSIKITAEESVNISENAQYDFQAIYLDGTRTKITENGNIKLRRGVGDKLD